MSGMRHRWSFATTVPAAVCLVAVGAMGYAAAILPYIGRPCLDCFSLGGQPPFEAMAVLTTSADAGFIVVALFLLAVAAVGQLAAKLPIVTAISCLTMSVAAVCIAVFEVRADRLEAWLTAPEPNGNVVPAPSTLEVGFYAFIVAAAAAVAASTVLVYASAHRARAAARASLRPAAL
jgi:hypothetical protein